MALRRVRVAALVGVLAGACLGVPARAGASDAVEGAACGDGATTDVGGVGAALLAAHATPARPRVRMQALAAVPLDDAQRLALAAQPGPLGALGLRELGRLHTPQATACLLDGLARADAGHRAAAAEALSGTGDRARLPTLLRMAARDPDPGARRAAEAAVLALGAAPSAPEDLDAALGALRAARTVDARVQALEGLARTGDRRAVEPVVELLGDPSAPVALAAARALREVPWMRDLRAVPALLRHLTRRGAEPATIGAVVRAWRPLAAVDVYVSELAHEQPRRRIVAVAVLGAIAPVPAEGASGPQAEALLLRALDDPDEGVRRAVRTTLVAEAHLPVTAALLAALLADRSPFLRAEAAVALGEGLHRRVDGGETTLTPALVALLRDREVLVRLSAADALLAIGAHAAEADVRASARRARGDARVHLARVADALAGARDGSP